MNDICDHCDETIIGNAYRVISEEDGVALLNMVVCASCAAVAKRLLLHTEEITPGAQDASAPAGANAPELFLACALNLCNGN